MAETLRLEIVTPDDTVPEGNFYMKGGIEEVAQA